MRKEGNKLVLKEEINDGMLEDFISKINNKRIEIIQIETDNICALALQQLFCINKEKEIICKNNFLSLFFENIEYK
ncbi:hypothetical protein [Malaciobacter canalis]|uniref:Uncharacterized protein n=1 Tax=Malaciobacter canalis TaxID=1912871 RepID=A0ABX4LN50_9BACT|nr:hypothetical protein [Malaciobacter canalis]PHO08968.1 hypothetical protein CPG37_11620 [Malaciobacter canalis]QEE32740.1 hypothetical protein ACAN_1258 [Malaciobacter canalis]